MLGIARRGCHPFLRGASVSFLGVRLTCCLQIRPVISFIFPGFNAMKKRKGESIQSETRDSVGPVCPSFWFGSHTILQHAEAGRISLLVLSKPMILNKQFLL